MALTARIRILETRNESKGMNAADRKSRMALNSPNPARPTACSLELIGIVVFIFFYRGIKTVEASPTSIMRGRHNFHGSSPYRPMSEGLR